MYIKTWGTVDKQNIVTEKNTSKNYFNIKIHVYWLYSHC